MCIGLRSFKSTIPELGSDMKEPLPYPRMCPGCCKRTVQPAAIRHVAKIKYEGKTYSVEIPDLQVGQCPCGEVLFDLETDARIDREFRRVARLLSPRDIRAARTRLGLKQGDLARELGVAKATISRWETRVLIQSRAMDKILRAFFHDSHVRDLMKQIDTDPSIGTIGESSSSLPPNVINARTNAQAALDSPSVMEKPLPVNRIAEFVHVLDQQRTEAAKIKRRGTFLTP
jgi:putative zinc finger/helix-turn-helix YgiT family protein